MISKFVLNLAFFKFSSGSQGLVFSLSRNQQTAPLPPSSTFLCFVSPCHQLFFPFLARSTKQTFCFFTDGKQHKAASSSGASFFAWQIRVRNVWLVMNRKGPWEGSPSRLPLRAHFHQRRDVWVRDSSTKRELDMITLRNHALRSYMTWLPVPLSVLEARWRQSRPRRWFRKFAISFRQSEKR